MIKNIVFLLCCLFSLPLMAQKPQGEGVVLGKVVDQLKKKPLEYVKVKLMDPKDSSIFLGQYTNDEGKFNFENLPYKLYLVSISFAGFETVFIQNSEPKNDLRIVNLGIVELVPNNQKVIDEITVLGKQDILKSGIDKKVYNVSEDLTLRGGTANDVLKNIPSVDLDQDGRILLRGEGSVNVLIDGKPSSLAGSNGKTLLDALPAGSIERIEIVTNPSAKYDPDGSSGIINIVLKKNKLKGFNGMVNANLGSGDLKGGNVAEGNVSLSYRSASINVFGSYTGRYLDGYRNNYLYSRQTLTNDSVVILDQVRLGTDLNAGQTMRGGLDWTMKNNRILSFTCTGALGVRDRTGDLWTSRKSEDSLVNEFVTSRWLRTSYDPSQQQNLDLNANFKQNFKSNRGSIMVDVNQSFGRDRIQGYYEQSYYTPAEVALANKANLLQRLSNVESNSVSAMQIDGTYLWPDLSIRSEFGAKAILRHQTVDTYSETQDSTDQLYYLDTLSNFLYQYDEKIFSVYGILAHQYKKFKYQAGLRVEKAYQIPDLVSDTIRIVNDYFNFFPSAHIRYVVKKGIELGLSYSRRITRASSADLNPFTSYADPLNLQRGNPYLQPEYIDSYDFGATREGKKLNLSASVYYRKTKDMISRVKIFNQENAAIMTMINLNSSNSLGTEFVISYKPINGFRNTLSANINYIQYQTNIESWNRAGFNYNVKLNSSFDFWKRTATIQLNVNYIAPRITILGTAQRRGPVDIGLDKRLGSHWSVGCKVTDVFNRQGFYMHVRQPAISQDVEFKWLTRRFYVNVSYKFGKLEMTKPKNNQDSGGGEM